MYRYYFTNWISKYGRKNFEYLTKRICRKITVPLKIKKKYGTDDFLFHYFFITYCTIALHHFGLNPKQISLILDISFVPGTSKLFSPSEILKIQKDVIPDIEKYIDNDLECY